VLYRTTLNVPPTTQATAYLVQYFEIIKRALTQVFSDTWDIFTKQQTDNGWVGDVFPGSHDGGLEEGTGFVGLPAASLELKE
jgi:hypothetical protein